MPDNKSALTSTLEGFGLSEYEARAYIALLAKGPVLASELAYHTGIPRTKSYSTIKSLVRKGLAKTLSGKPVKCQAVPPEDCLDTLVTEQEIRLKGMRKTLVKLRQIRDDQRKPLSAEQGRHLILSSNAIGGHLAESILSARHALHCVVDGWGIRLLEMAKDAILNATLNDVEAKVVVIWSPNGNGWDNVPGNAEIRVGKHTIGYNIFMLDEATILFANSSSGMGLMIHSKELCAIVERNLFNSIWEKSIPSKDVSTLMALQCGEDVLDLIVQDNVNEIFAKAVAQAVDNEKTLIEIGSKFIQILEQELHVNIFQKPTEISLPLLTTLLLQSLEEESSVRYDPVTRLLTVESTGDAAGRIPQSVWMFAIAGLLNRNHSALTILQNRCYQAENTHILQAKISRSTS